MTGWTRVYKSEDKPIYVYRREDGTYKINGYSFLRVHKGEDALKNTIQYVKDLGDYAVKIKENDD
jgi:hypothetical protein